MSANKKKNRKNSIHISKYRTNIWANLKPEEKIAFIEELSCDKSENAGKVLIHLLDEDNSEIKRLIAQSIKNRRDVVTILVDSFNSDIWTVKKSASFFLATFGKKAVKKIVDFINTHPKMDLFWPIETLGMLGIDGGKALKSLLKKVEAKDLGYVISGLGNTGSTEHFQFFTKCLKAPSWQVRKAAHKAIVRLGKKAVPLILKEFDSGKLIDDQVFWLLKSLNELSMFVNASKLIPLLTHSEEEIRMKAIGVIGMCQKVSKKVYSALLKLLGDKFWPVRKAAADAIFLIGEEGEKELVCSLKSKNDNIRFWSIRLIGDLGMKAHARAIMALLKDENSSIRGQAAFTLGLLQYKEALPFLFDHMQQEINEHVKDNIVRSLQMLGSEQVPLRDAM